MGRAPCCSKVGLQRGPWTAIEDALLTKYVQSHGEGNWKSLPKEAGLLRCGKSCRLRWMNYLRPDIKRGNIGPDEEDLITRLQSLIGNRWSLIAGRLPGRTDNEIKNYWNSHLSKRLRNEGIRLRGRTPRASSGQSQLSHKKSNDTNNKSDHVNHERRRKKNEMEDNGEATRIEIHTPKPTRFRPTMRNYNKMEDTSVSDPKTRNTTTEEEKGETSLEDLDITWPVIDESSFFLDDDDVVLAGDVPHKEELLEKLYQEYSQLLNSDRSGSAGLLC